jgi:hypothetical protein
MSYPRSIINPTCEVTPHVIFLLIQFSVKAMPFNVPPNVCTHISEQLSFHHKNSTRRGRSCAILPNLRTS